MIKAVDKNLANFKDKNTFTSLKTDANQYLTLISILWALVPYKLVKRYYEVVIRL